MSLMDFFRNAAPQPTAATAGSQPVVPVDPNNPTAPAAAVQAQTETKSPMEEFARIWEPNAAGDTPTSPFAGFDPNKVNEAVSKVDFTKVLPSDTLAKIAAGGEEAATAFATAINSVAQASFAQSTIANTKVMEKALETQREAFMKELPSIIKRQGLSDNLATQNPLLTNPAAQPVVEAIKSQMVAKFPNATQSELADLTNRYLNDFAGLITKPATEATQAAATKSSQGFDWDAWASRS